LLKVNKKHDYFTSCLPAPQKGDSALIPIALNELIPVITGSEIGSIGVGNRALNWQRVDGNAMPTGQNALNVSRVLSEDGFRSRLGNNSAGNGNLTLDVRPSNLWADGRNLQINATTIHELRTAFQIQKLFERDARGGTRYVEMLKAHFGVEAEDYRLQRPEFLGHCHSVVGIHQVPQTSATGITGSDSPQGNLSAFSYTVGEKKFFKKSFTEHGYLHIFAVARQTKTYQQGLQRFWSRRDRLDFYMPVLSHISEQPVYAKEIFASTSLSQNNEIFGFNEAWADYRYKPNSVTGQMRSGVTNSLDVWHYADWYNTRPFLSADWIRDNSGINVDRTIAIPRFNPNGTIQPDGNDQLILDIAFKCKTTRPMPVHSIPGFVDHF
jgi:hypothetical protein